MIDTDKNVHLARPAIPAATKRRLGQLADDAGLRVSELVSVILIDFAARGHLNDIRPLVETRIERMSRANVITLKRRHKIVEKFREARAEARLDGVPLQKAVNRLAAQVNADGFSVSARTIFRWARRYSREGLFGLTDKRKGKRLDPTAPQAVRSTIKPGSRDV